MRIVHVIIFIQLFVLSFPHFLSDFDACFALLGGDYPDADPD